jgi:hypothetical protein
LAVIIVIVIIEVTVIILIVITEVAVAVIIVIVIEVVSSHLFLCIIKFVLVQHGCYCETLIFLVSKG